MTTEPAIDSQRGPAAAPAPPENLPHGADLDSLLEASRDHLQLQMLLIEVASCNESADASWRNCVSTRPPSLLACCMTSSKIRT